VGAAQSPGGLRFLGATASPDTEITLGAFNGYIDPRVVAVMQSSIKVLGRFLVLPGMHRPTRHGRAIASHFVL
jgi:hypothetical protein